MPLISRAAVYGLLLSAGLVAALPARAAFEFQPGQWQETETGEENGKQVPPETSTSCMTPEEAKDPVKSLSVMKDAAGQCKKLDIQQKGNIVTIVMQCGDPKEMSIDLAASYSFLNSRHYTGTMKTTVILAGKKTTADKTIDSKWTGPGPCKK